MCVFSPTCTEKEPYVGEIPIRITSRWRSMASPAADASNAPDEETSAQSAGGTLETFDILLLPTDNDALQRRRRARPAPTTWYLIYPRISLNPVPEKVSSGVTTVLTPSARVPSTRLSVYVYKPHRISCEHTRIAARHLAAQPLITRPPPPCYAQKRLRSRATAGFASRSTSSLTESDASSRVRLWPTSAASSPKTRSARDDSIIIFLFM